VRSLRVGIASTVVLAVGATAVAVGQSGPDKSVSLKAAIDVSKPKNIILFIGDGTGDSELTLGRYYAKGASGRLALDSLRFRGDVITHSLAPAAAPPYPPLYVPDSSATAAAWSSGIKTLDGRVGQGPSSGSSVPGVNVPTYMEIARDRGLSTGVVSTAEITDATPSAPSSHISRRDCHGPQNTRQFCPRETKAAGGLGSIAEQQADSGFDLFLGGGRSRFTQTLDNSTRTALQYATEDKGYRYVATGAELAEVTSLAPGERLLGLFHNSTMTTTFAPLIAAQNGAGSTTTKCTPQDRGNEPTLKEMTEKAISLLKGNPKGFVLQVESASIDKRAHNSDVCGQIGETIALDEAVAAAMEFQAENPDTLIMVTADHAHTGQIVVPNVTPRGLYATLQTVDGAPIRVSYATAQAAGSMNHTGVTVPVLANGPRAADVVGTLDQTELFPILTNTRTGDGPVPAAPAEVGGEVLPTLALDTEGTVAFSPFVPGLARDYTASLAASVTSSAADATLSIADSSPTAPGHLVNGEFVLPQALHVGLGDTLEPVGGSTAPTPLKTYAAPISNDPVSVNFRQSIGAADALRTGTYAKSLTLTLSTTRP